MRKTTILGALLLIAIANIFAQTNINKAGQKMKRADKINSYSTLREELPTIPCPPNTVKASEFDYNEAGFQCSDEGRPDFSMQFFQKFHDCYYSVDSVRVLAHFTSFNNQEGWHGCMDRDIFDAEGNIVKPLKMQLSFYEIDKDGMPGNQVAYKIQDVVGVNTGVISNYSGPIYSFTLKLDKPVKMESGYFSVSAVKPEKDPSCWFAAVTCFSDEEMGLIKMHGKDWMKALGNMCYCFMGDGKMIAQKALKIQGFIRPFSFLNAPYNKVQVWIKNIGSKEITNPTLKLLCDNNLVDITTANVTLQPLERYRFTFNQPIEVNYGKHILEVVNMISDDEKIADESIKGQVYYYVPGTTCESKSTRKGRGITKVEIGDFVNESGLSDYSDFRAKKIEIEPGEELNITATFEGDIRYMAAFVDWNNNGIIGEDYELIGYLGKNKPIKLKIPQDIDIEAGEKRLRIIAANSIPTPCGSYGYGETEDYTLVVKPAANEPQLKCGSTIIFGKYSNPHVDFNIQNNGNKDLTGKVSIRYILPNTPFSLDALRKSNAMGSDLRAEAEEPETEQYAYTLQYDNGVKSAMGFKSNIGYFATYYPAQMLQPLAKNKIESVDVYFQSIPEKASIVIFTGDKQSVPNKQIYEQAFTPVEMSWNRVKLNTPIEIGNRDLWITVRIEGLKEKTYYVGTDKGYALRGYADIATSDPFSEWYSAGEGGYELNFCIRANVSGEKPGVVNWIKCNDTAFNIAPQESNSISLELNNKDLDFSNIYEAIMKIQSNDPLRREVIIPIYCLNMESVESIDLDDINLIYNQENESLQVKSLKKISRISLYDTNGRMLYNDIVDAQEGIVPMYHMPKVLYIALIQFVDGSVKVVKFIK